MKKVNFSIIILLVILLSSIQHKAQQTTSTIDTTNKLSRFRIATGYTALVQEGSDFEFGQYFFNLNYRTSGFKRESGNFKVKFAFEPGINALVISERSADFEFIFLPYAKFGPELKLDQNFLFSGSIGLILPLVAYAFSPFPFWGVNSFYLFPITSKTNIELEGGFHTAFSERFPFLVYITLGFSFD